MLESNEPVERDKDMLRLTDKRLYCPTYKVVVTENCEPRPTIGGIEMLMEVGDVGEDRVNIKGFIIKFVFSIVGYR